MKNLSLQLFWGISLAALLYSCSMEEKKPKVAGTEESNYKPQPEIKIDKPESEKNKNTKPDLEEDDYGYPPFPDTCDCSFQHLGNFRFSPKRYDIVISGKGWNPEYVSCTYTWGEYISNVFPPDTLVTDFRIHLVDIEKLEKPLDSLWFESKRFKNNAIATYAHYEGSQYMVTRFDPFKTGKYKTPEQWME